MKVYYSRNVAPDAKRPTRFSADQDDRGMRYFVLKRAPKPAAKEAQASAAWGEAVGGVRVGLASAAAGEFTITFENVSTEGTLLNLGIMLGDGKKQSPSALSLTATSVGPRPRHALLSHRFAFASPRTSGRVDPLLVPLGPGTTYTLRLTLGDFLLQGPADGFSSTPGTRLPFTVVFVGKAVGSTGPGAERLKSLTCWTGTIHSGSALITLPQKAAD